MAVTAVHRYVIAPEAGGCHVSYTEDLTRLDGAPWMLRTPGISRIVFRVSAKYMGRGFDGLLTLAQEQAATSPSTDESGKP